VTLEVPPQCGGVSSAFRIVRAERVGADEAPHRFRRCGPFGSLAPQGGGVPSEHGLSERSESAPKRRRGMTVPPQGGGGPSEHGLS
jgi:hypothetical protein